MNNPKRVYQIDLFRFVAALAVVLYHYTSFYGISQPQGAIFPFPLLGEIFKYGYLGVDLFFIISGFVIALSIRQRSLSKFWKSRITRLYPAFWVCLLITFTVVVIWGGSRFDVTEVQLLANATMLNAFMGIDHVDGAYWSLYVEMKFYILIALYLTVRKVLPIRLHHIIFAWLALSTAYAFTDFGQHTILRILRSAFILEYSPLFIAGMLFFRVYRNEGKWSNAAGLLLCLALCVSQSLENMRSMENIFGYTLSPVIVISMIASFFALMYLTSTERLQSLNSGKYLQLGMLTYPLYLLHQRVGYVFFDEVMTADNKYAVLAFAIAMALIAAYSINKLIEIRLSNAVESLLDRLFPVRPSTYLK